MHAARGVRGLARRLSAVCSRSSNHGPGVWTCSQPARARLLTIAPTSPLPLAILATRTSPCR